MNKLYLSINGLPAHTDIFLDGKYYKPKKVKNHHPVIEYETEKDSVELTIKRYSHLSSRLWVLQELFFYIISIFGIFDKKFGKYYYKEYCNIVFKVQNETKATIKFNPPLSVRPVLNCKSDAEINEVENVYRVDRELKRKHKILTIVKVLIFLGAVAGLITFLLVK